MRNTKININKKFVTILLLIACFFISLSFFMFTVANASSNNIPSDYFGIGKNTHSTNREVGKISNDQYQNPENFESSQTSLASFSTRDISTAASSINFRIEERRKIEEAQRKAAELIKINWLKNIQNKFIANYGWPDNNLPLINYDLGHDTFIDVWSKTIDEYLQITEKPEDAPLAGKGKIFAEEAWEKGIDPRWSPAISNTESSKGLYCFAPHNAWGWGDGGWESWEEAIPAHIDGLIKGYGFTIKKEFAEKYCPPNHDNWYDNTLSEMIKISNIYNKYVPE